MWKRSEELRLERAKKAFEATQCWRQQPHEVITSQARLAWPLNSCPAGTAGHQLCRACTQSTVTLRATLHPRCKGISPQI